MRIRPRILIRDDLDETPLIEALSDRAFRRTIELWVWCARRGPELPVTSADLGNLHITPAVLRELKTAHILVPNGDIWTVPDDTGWQAITGTTIAPRPAIPASVRLAVYERDDWTCQPCGLRIPPRTEQEQTGLRAPRTALGVPLTLDHRVPYSCGGADTVENLRAACLPCNAARGARPLAEAAVR